MKQSLAFDAHQGVHILMVMPDAASPLLCPEARTLKQRLQSLPSIHCHICTDSQQAVAMALSCQPLVIFQDMHMQGTHGLDMLRIYQHHPNLKDIAVWMVDMRQHTLLRRYAFAAGASDYLSHAISSQECLAKLQSVSQLAQIKQQNTHLSQHLKRNEAQLTQYHQQLQHASSLDALTVLPSRQHFMKIYEREWRRALRETDALSLLLIDIDHFKAYNDIYGYQKGDQCLHQIAQSIPNLLRRPTDVCGRYAGAAFVILLPMTPAKGAIQVAQRVRLAVHDLNIPHQTSPVSSCVTVSIGLVTTCPMLKHQTRDMVRKVERACFDAKQEGRNQLVCKSL